MKNKIKLFITDIDGVWTDGSMYYDQKGNELKRFNTYDSAGVELLRKISIPTVIITGEKTEIVKKRAEKLKIKHVYQGVSNKLKIAQKLCDSLSICLEEVAFIGDDLNDYKLLKAVGLSACPSNATEKIKSIVDWKLNIKGGDGAYRFFVEKYLKEIEQLEDCINSII
ncbi:HAD-IIIA family hydrolase [Flavobacteriaceae bacterium]|nr:HAD-IIIA family hydrolase [Flavobacteriaceae bacterium]